MSVPDIGNIRIYGDETSGVYVGDKGSTGPDDLDIPAAAFVNVGWLSEDGIAEAIAQDATTHRAFQGAKVVRRKITSADRTFRIQCLEENAVTMNLSYRGQEPVITGGVAKITVTNQTKQDDRAWIIDLVDGDVTKRHVIPSGSYELTGTIEAKNSGITIHEYTITPQGDFYVLTNNTALIP